MYWSSLYLSLLLSLLFPLLLIITDYVLFYGQSVHHLFSTAVLSIHTIQRKSKLIVRVPHNRDLCVDVTRNKEKKRKGERDTLRACRWRKDTRRRANEQMNTKHPLVSTTTRPFHLFSSTLSVTATARTNRSRRGNSCRLLFSLRRPKCRWCKCIYDRVYVLSCEGTWRETKDRAFLSSIAICATTRPQIPTSHESRLKRGNDVTSVTFFPPPPFFF